MTFYNAGLCNISMFKYFIYFSFLICLLFPVTVFSQVKTVEAIDRGEVSKIIIRLDKVSKYNLVKKTSRNIVIIIDDKLSNTDMIISNKSKLIKSFKQVYKKDGTVSFNVVFNRNISNVSDFSLKSPPRILLNIDVSNVGNLPEEEFIIPVEPKGTKNKKRGGNQRSGSYKKLRDKKKNDKEEAYKFEGLEDIVTPSLDPFIEIFGTDEAISIYHIKLPPFNELPDYIGRPRKIGDYDLKNRYLINAARNIGNGEYERAFELLNDLAPEIKKMENYALLRADAEFQKALSEDDENLNEAMKFYNEMIIKYPQPKHAPWALIQSGIGYLHLGRYRKAIRLLEGVINNNKNSPYVERAKLLLARTLSMQNKKEDAIRIYKKFIEESPESPFFAEAVFGAAQNMAQKGRYRKAVALFERGIQKWPQYAFSDPEILMNVAESYYFMQKFDNALKYYIRVANLYPEHKLGSKAMARIGDIYIYLDNFETAKKIFLEIDSIYPGSDGALIGKVRIADLLVSRDAETDEIMSHYKSVYKKYPKSPIAPIARLKAGMLLSKRKELIKALDLYVTFKQLYSKNKLNKKVLEEILKVFPALLEEINEKNDCLEILRLSKKHKNFFMAVADKGSSIIVGNCFFKYGKYKNALANYEIIKKGDKFNSALFMKGKALYLLGKIDEAISVMEKFIRLFPDNKNGIELKYLLAQEYEKKGSFSKAIEFYRFFGKTYHDDILRADANIKLAGLLRKTDNLDGADIAFKAAIKLYPKKNNLKLSKAYFSFGEFLYMRGDFKTALESYNNAIENASEKRYEEAQYKAAFCLYKTGDIVKAKEMFQELSEGAGDLFWKSLSEKTVKDIIFQASI